MKALRQDYVNLRNKYKDNTKGIFQQDYVQFLYKFYVENGKKCSSPEEFVDGFYYTMEQTVFGLQKTNRDISSVQPTLDGYFGIVSLHGNIIQVGSMVGEFIKVIN